MAQIGTIGLQTQNNGVINVPVFESGDSSGSVYEMVRVQTASGVGFIPAVDPADASFPYVRVQTENYGVLALHDIATLSTESVIVFDKSGSMGTDNNYEDANTDAEQMLSNLTESDYRFALVSFEDSGSLDQELGSPYSDINYTIDNYVVDGGTEPQTGIDIANEILSGNDVSSASPSVTADQDLPHVQVIFTDDEDADSETINASDAAKNNGQTLIVIGYDGYNSSWETDIADIFYDESTTNVGEKVADDIKNTS